MSNFQGPNGTLFPNQNKKMDKHPDYTGELEFDAEAIQSIRDQITSGVEYPKVSIAGWKRVVKKNGNVFLSIKASPTREKVERDNQPSPQPSNDDDFSL